MTFVVRRRVGGRFYLYEMESFRNEAGEPRNRIVRYLGPEEPVYGQVREARTVGEPKNGSRGKSPEERRAERELEREQARIDRDLDHRRRR